MAQRRKNILEKIIEFFKTILRLFKVGGSGQFFFNYRKQTIQTIQGDKIETVEFKVDLKGRLN